MKKISEKACVSLMIIFIITLNACVSQTNTKKYENAIIGKWYGTKKETKNGNDKLRNGKPNRELGKFQFKKDNIVIDLTMEPSFIDQYKYSISGDILKLGSLLFKIEKLTDQEMILLDYDPTDPNTSVAFRHYFVKKDYTP